MEICLLWDHMVENPFPKQDQGQVEVTIFVSD